MNKYISKNREIIKKLKQDNIKNHNLVFGEVYQANREKGTALSIYVYNDEELMREFGNYSIDVLIKKLEKSEDHYITTNGKMHLVVNGL